MIQPFLTDQLIRVHRTRFPRGNPEQWLFDHFNFIVAKGDDENYETYDLDWLLDRAIAACVRYNIKALVIDPWNEIEHQFHKTELQTDYISRAIRRLKRFAYQYGVLVIVVAHPTKGASDKKKSADIELYDIADSAHWHNKSDFGVTVARVENSNVTNIYVRKVRNQPIFGRRGWTYFTFSNGTFSE